MLRGSPAMLGGGPAYVVAGRSLYIGIEGAYLEGDPDDFMVGYAGASVGYLFFPRSPAAVMVSCLIDPRGGGSASAGGGTESTALPVIEPEGSLLVSLGETARIGLALSCRLALCRSPMRRAIPCRRCQLAFDKPYEPC